MASNPDGPKSKAFLIGTNKAGIVMETVEMSLDDYYENGALILDSNAYRASRAITRLNGRLYDFNGNLLQEFRNEYGQDGTYIGGKTTHMDGTITSG